MTGIAVLLSCESFLSSSSAPTASIPNRSIKMPLACPIASRLASADSNCCSLFTTDSAIAAWVASIAPSASASAEKARGLRASRLSAADAPCDGLAMTSTSTCREPTARMLSGATVYALVVAVRGDRGSHDARQNLGAARPGMVLTLDEPPPAQHPRATSRSRTPTARRARTRRDRRSGSGQRRPGKHAHGPSSPCRSVRPRLRAGPPPPPGFERSRRGVGL